MGQAFRRASGRIRPTNTSFVSNTKPAVRPPPTVIADKEAMISKDGEQGELDADGHPRVNVDNILEERDPKYDAMLGQMVGRITSKPGGKAEMGEAFLVEKYNRPMPKLRNTKQDSSGYEARPAPTGTLNIAQLRHITLLHEGKADDHDGPMDVHKIAEKFQVDVAQIQKVLQFLSQAPEGICKDNTKRQD